MSDQLKHNDLHFFFLIKKDDEKAFEEIYNIYSNELFNYIIGKVRIKEVAEEILQEIFLSLWKNRHQLEIQTSLKSYLYSASKYKVLNYIRSETVYKKYALHFAFFLTENYNNSTQELLELSDLEIEIEKLISELPERCQDAFCLSRMEYLSLDEIAEKMGISKRTVENYITQALKHLKKSLVSYTPLILLWYKFLGNKI